MRVLDLGCGFSMSSQRLWPEAEIVRVDLNPETKPDVLADVRKLPDDLGQFDAIMASHILEHLERTEAVGTVKHWASFLKGDGEIYIFVPDLVWAAEQLIRQRVTIQVLMHIYGGGQGHQDQHRWGYTMLLLRSLLHQAGLQVTEARTGYYGVVYPEGAEPVMARMLYVRARNASLEGHDNVQGTSG